VVIEMAQKIKADKNILLLWMHLTGLPGIGRKSRVLFCGEAGESRRLIVDLHVYGCSRLGIASELIQKKLKSKLWIASSRRLEQVGHVVFGGDLQPTDPKCEICR